MKRFSKSYKLSDKDEFIKKAISLSKKKSNFILLNSNDFSDTYDAIIAYDELSSIKSKNNSLSKLDNYIKEKKDWVFGFLSYDLKNEIEILNEKNIDVFDLPNVYFFQPKTIWLIKNNIATIISINKDAVINDWNEIISLTNFINENEKNNIELFFRNTKDEYVDKVKKIKERIIRGDCYEMNFCFDIFNDNKTIDPYYTYNKLNEYTKSPMSTFLKIEDLFLISSSPERFLKKIDNIITSEPIKGTAKRGANKSEDKLNVKNLLSSPKELSENHMIVDLVRNDLSKIAKKGSVIVKKLNELNTFKRVHQLVSSINAIINPNTKFSHIIRATFPMGSMTGAPKIESMKIIDEYESTKRGLYSGSVGYIKPNMDFDFNVVIRSIIYSKKHKKINISVGSAITFKSNADSEYDECLLKAEPMIKSLK
ncbi:MAG: chorismate-binding protein [Flavobacteriaceae bacterium]